jgi:hypothetical protein
MFAVSLVLFNIDRKCESPIPFLLQARRISPGQTIDSRLSNDFRTSAVGLGSALPDAAQSEPEMSKQGTIAEGKAEEMAR